MFSAKMNLIKIACLLFIISLNSYAADDDKNADEEGVPSEYIEITPAFVTNYGDSSRLRYMKVEVTLRVTGADGKSQVEHHMPYIKDILLSLFSEQTSKTIMSAVGKEDLRQQSFQAVTVILEKEDKESYLEDLLFTSFVAHR